MKILETIVAQKRQEVAKLKAARDPRSAAVSRAITGIHSGPETIPGDCSNC